MPCCTGSSSCVVVWAENALATPSPAASTQRMSGHAASVVAVVVDVVNGCWFSSCHRYVCRDMFLT
jgi:hypothetical protein